MVGLYAWLLLTVAAVGVAGFTARTARERGRGGAVWGALSIVAAIVGQVTGALVFGWIWKSADAFTSFGATVWGMFAVLLGPLAAMVIVLLVLIRLPESVPSIRGARWPVHQMSTNNNPGGECLLLVEGGRLHLGDTIIVNGKDVTEIAADRECLRITWLDQSVLVMPAGKLFTSRERIKQVLALEKRLRVLLDPDRGG